MNLFIIAIPIVLIIPAFYWLFSRKARGGSGANRPDHQERPELTGTEQAKRREPR